eukprot:UN4512
MANGGVGVRSLGLHIGGVNLLRVRLSEGVLGEARRAISVLVGGDVCLRGLVAHYVVVRLRTDFKAFLRRQGSLVPGAGHVCLEAGALLGLSRCRRRDHSGCRPKGVFLSDSQGP